ncbi:MAG: HigA family addiction module antidote protein [Bacteroides sp.]|nr:HigA family addiction module antidote protein [Bacteroides sp.]
MANKDMAQTRPFFDPAKLPVVYHPGETLDEKLQEIGMGVKEFATRVSKPEKTIIAVLKGNSSITPDMAVAFEMVTKIPADMWLRLQKNYDEFLARKKREKSLKEGLQWANKFPYAEIASLGWFSGITDSHGGTKNIVDTLCTFFAVSSPKGWEDFYLNQRLRVAFSITLAEVCDPYALSAWLRQGEIQASEISINITYKSILLRGILDQISEIRKSGTPNRNELLSSLLAIAGIKLVFTDTLSSAPVKGCARYIYGIPCIQLAKKFECEADFWNTLFHEIGHILLHGKKDIFMENVNYGNKDLKKEKQADEFAALWMSK